MSYLKVEFFVPLEHVKSIVDALNQDQLLTEGNYDYCFAYTPVKGHFRPLQDANPYIGNVNEITQVDEVKVECRIDALAKAKAERLIKEQHPYEVPVINFIELL